MKQKILIIVGPTASGKSDFGVMLAKKFKGEVISADSRQVYKGLDIGSGKITKQEMKSVPHYLLSIADPKKQFSVSDYKKLAEEAQRKIEKKNKLPIIVGGTGFYIDTLLGASLPEVPANKTLRAKLNKLNADKLFSLLKKKDIRRARNIDKHNKVRLIRALEIVDAIGKVPTLDIKKQNDRKYIWIGLKPKQKDLEEKIYKRLISRLPRMIREAKKLHDQGLSFKRMEELGLEYRYLARLLQKKIAKDEFIEQLFLESKKYSKRQMTWFKRNKNIKWFKPNEKEKISKYVKGVL